VQVRFCYIQLRNDIYFLLVLSLVLRVEVSRTGLKLRAWCGCRHIGLHLLTGDERVSRVEWRGVFSIPQTTAWATRLEVCRIVGFSRVRQDTERWLVLLRMCVICLLVILVLSDEGLSNG
jgi:hypothetical protein